MSPADRQDESVTGPESGVPMDVFRQRRDRVRDVLGSGVLVLEAAPVRFKNGDTDYRYRPDSDLFYLTGVAEPNAVFVLSGHGSAPESVLFLPERDPAAERWHGPRIGPEEAGDRYGVEAAYASATLSDRLPGLLGHGDVLYARMDAAGTVAGLVLGAVATGRASRRRTGAGPAGVLDPGVVLDELRLRKDEIEVTAIRRACRLTVEGHRAGLGAVAPERGEWQVEAAIEGAFRAAGAFGPAFGTIVASGANACVLHHTANDRIMADGDLVLIDAGAEVGFYAGDITRTVPVSGRFSAEQRALYDIVDEARAQAVGVVAPGASVQAPHEAALSRMVRGLIDLGVLQGAVADRLGDGSSARYVIHKTSHWLGLDVHDVGSYVVNGEPRSLEPGMVLTIEPGIYFAPDDDTVPEPFRGLGVRIEDDVVVTATGAENLTAALPTGADAVEALMAELGSTREASAGT